MKPFLFMVKIKYHILNQTISFIFNNRLITNDFSFECIRSSIQDEMKKQDRVSFNKTYKANLFLIKNNSGMQVIMAINQYTDA